MAITNKNIAQINHSLFGETGKSTKPTNFARIRNFNDRNSAITHDGILVSRQEYLWVDGYGMVRCLPTTMHFIYEDKSKVRGRWTWMCSCGSIAGVVGYKDLVGLSSPELGEHVLVCVYGLSCKQNIGIFRHADGSTE